jgi:antitoxin component YwqK of YwqJK toxin-antitoxin module
MKPSIALALAVLSVFVALLTGCDNLNKEVPFSKLNFDGTTFIDPSNNRPFTGVTKDNHKNGQPRIEWHIKDGKLDGTQKEWYPNGKQLSVTEYKEGTRTGKNTEWTEVGLLYRERVYDHDKIMSEKNYEAGK